MRSPAASKVRMRSGGKCSQIDWSNASAASGDVRATTRCERTSRVTSISAPIGSTTTTRPCSQPSRAVVESVTSSGRMPSVTALAVARVVEQVDRRAAEKRRDERVGRLAIEIERAAHLHDGAVSEHRDPARERHRFRLIVRHVDHRRTELVVQTFQLGARLQSKLRVEVRQRFIHQIHGGAADDRARKRDALLLSAGELCRPAIEMPARVRRVRPLRAPGDRFPPRGTDRARSGNATLSNTVKCG